MSINALLDQGQKIEIGGKSYVVRRLNVMDVFAVADLLGKVGNDLADLFLTDEGELNEGIGGRQLVFKLIGVIPKCREELAVLFADLISISRDEFVKLPPTALFKLITALKDNEDLKAFFVEVRTVLTELAPKGTAK